MGNRHAARFVERLDDDRGTLRRLPHEVRLGPAVLRLLQQRDHPAITLSQPQCAAGDANRVVYPLAEGFDEHAALWAAVESAIPTGWAEPESPPGRQAGRRVGSRR